MYGGVSPQECPLYSYQDVSMALRMPYSTLYSWLKGSHTKPVITVSTSKEPLNFLQLSEAFVINYMRKTLGISFQGYGRHLYSSGVSWVLFTH